MPDGIETGTAVLARQGRPGTPRRVLQAVQIAPMGAGGTSPVKTDYPNLPGKFAVWEAEGRLAASAFDANTGFIATSDTPPDNPVPGTAWWDSSDDGGQLYVFYDDGTSSQWVVAFNQPGPTGPAGPTGPQGVPGPTGPGVDYPEQSILTPTVGQTLDVPDVSKTILNPAVALATLTLRLPAAADKRTLRIATRLRIDALTVIARGGHTVDWITGELPANGIIDLTLVTSLNAWVRA
jgi:hypothetical protein